MNKRFIVPSLMVVIMEFPAQDREKRYTDDKGLVTTWTGEELLDGRLEKSFTAILRTTGCSWSRQSGCTMCGYHTASNPTIKPEALLTQLEEALSRYDGQKVVKIYTSGSFLDEREIPVEVATAILRRFKAKRIIVESRPEYVNKDVLDTYSAHGVQLEIAIGLESSKDFVLKNCINKGFSVKDYRDARDIIFSEGCYLRTYLLLKPPFLTELEAIEDLTSSISTVSHPQNIVSINPLNVQKDTLVERLWYRNQYRPPWIWSLFEAILSSDKVSHVVISKAGLGSKRGAHNCSNCDEELIKVIDKFNISQDYSILEESFSICDCTEKWSSQKDIEPLLHHRGSIEILSDRYAGYIGVPHHYHPRNR